MDTKGRAVDLLFEVGTMRHISRSWSQFGGLQFANVAEHSYRVVWIALVLARDEGADIAKTLQMAMIHDLPETRTGDGNYVNREYVAYNEVGAVKDSLAGTPLESELLPLWREYKDRETLEARIVKDADTLDCDLELRELKSRGSDLPEVLQDTRMRAFEQLHTATARRLFREIEGASCHDWHKKSKNRLNNGDWRHREQGDCGRSKI